MSAGRLVFIMGLGSLAALGVGGVLREAHVGGGVRVGKWNRGQWPSL